jgi:DNA primase catalytic core
MNATPHESLAERIKRDVRLLDVAGEYASEIWQRGRTQVCRCLCGQNSDRNPSFTLYDDHYHCFACGRHGSVIDLVMLVENLDFKAALEFLQRHHLSGYERSTPLRRIAQRLPPQERGVDDEVRTILDAATTHYQTTLFKMPDVLHYLHTRGLTDSTLQRMKIGYARGDLGQTLFAQGLDLGVAARAGLISPRGEFLRGRIVIPVLDAQCRAMWLIGRAIQEGDSPKYLGLPEGAVHKQPMVMGSARRSTIWVEGAFDVAALVQWGLDEDYLLVGMLGTACESIVQMLLPGLISHAIVCTDQDFAGKQAALKLAIRLSAHGITSTVLADADRHQRVAAWVAHAKQQTHLSDRARAKLTQGQKELETVETLVSQHFMRWVQWSNAAKDPGDLCKLGQRGRQLFLDALPT